MTKKKNEPSDISASEKLDQLILKKQDENRILKRLFENLDKRIEVDRAEKAKSDKKKSI